MIISDNQVLRMIAEHFILQGVIRGNVEHSVSKDEIRLYGGFTPSNFASCFPFIVAYIQQNELVHHTKVGSKFITIYYINKELENNDKRRIN